MPFVKDAFHDHIVKSHRPAEPDAAPNLSELKTSPSVKSPRLPPHHTSAEEGEVASSSGEETAPPATHPDAPPRSVSEAGGRQFINPAKEGTKAGAHYSFSQVPPRGGCVVVRLKMTEALPEEDSTIVDEEAFDDLVEDRRTDADEFYARLASGPISDDLRNVMRQALSGMLWFVFFQLGWGGGLFFLLNNWYPFF